MEVADRVVLMNRGRVEQIGTPRQIYSEPATAFAYSFVGAVNEFFGRIEATGVRVGRDLLPLTDMTAPAGREVVVYVRPQDIVIRPAGGDETGIVAVVRRILDVGASTRVELLREGGTLEPGQRYVEAELPAAGFGSLGLAAGQAVRLTASRLRLFERAEREGVV